MWSALLPLTPLHAATVQQGLLTALVVGFNWVILVMIIPSAIGFWWRYLAPCEAKSFLCCLSCCDKDDEEEEEADKDGERRPKSRRVSDFVLSRIGADQRRDPFKRDGDSPAYVEPPRFSQATFDETIEDEEDEGSSTSMAFFPPFLSCVFWALDRSKYVLSFTGCV
jgi:hypothetical protein